jgi:hypothetical protein
MEIVAIYPASIKSLQALGRQAMVALEAREMEKRARLCWRDRG